MKKIERITKGNFIERFLFPLYSFLFIFSTVNREFLFFGFDLRFITFGLGLILIILSASNKGRLNRNKARIKTKKDPIFSIICLFLIWCLLSNVSWLWNGLELNGAQWQNQNVLLLNNILAILVFYLYKNIVKSSRIRKFMIFSCVILVISFVLTGLGYKLYEISGSNVRSMSSSRTGADMKNLYGGDFRLAGYAEDANYASILLALGILASLQLGDKKRFLKIIFTVIFVISIGLSASKTVLISMLVGILYVIIIKLNKKRNIKPVLINSLIVPILFISSFVLPHMHILSSLNTMSTRYYLWGIAEQTFYKSPLIGNGIGSSRSAINEDNNGLWYVQPHSNFWQILAETGIIGMVLFAILVKRCLDNEENSNLDKVAIIMLVVFGFTFEIIQLQVFVYVMYILSLRDDDYSSSRKGKNA